MKIFLFSLFFIFVYAFEVQFTKTYTEYVIPKKDAILIETKKDDLTFPFKYVKTKKGYILIGDERKIDMWLNNEFYAPKDAKFKDIKIAYVNLDKLQYKVINKIRKEYRQCEIKKVIFLNPDEDILITKPKKIKLNYQIFLDCK